MLRKLGKWLSHFYGLLKVFFGKVLEVYEFNMLLMEAIIISGFIVLCDVFEVFKHIVDKASFLLVLLILMMVGVFCKKENKKLIKTKNVNSIDKCIFVWNLINGLCLIYVHLFNYYFCNTVILAFSYFLCNFFLIFRWNHLNNIVSKKNYTVIDLNDIYEKKIYIKSGENFLLKEQSVSYDLLQRSTIINRLYNTIISCVPENSFTIGLNGKWGSGKTTIVDNVLRLLKDNNIVDNYHIVKFDPWKYDDEKSILKGFLSEILKDIPFEFHYENIDVLIDAMINVVFENKNINYWQLITSEIGNLKNKLKIENIVNNYLKSNDKQLLIIIDNLDRVDERKAIFLIKCVEAIVSFENTIYILLYDEEILNCMCNEMFHTEKNNCNYMEKIVQLRIDIPQVDRKIINNIKNKVVSNIYVDDKPILKYLSNFDLKFATLREFKRFLNGILFTNNYLNEYLDSEDYAKLFYIKYTNSNLYYCIWNNKKYFVSYDRNLDYGVTEMLTSKFNDEAKDFFNDLFSSTSNSEYKDLLSSMFQSVYNYFNKNSHIYSYYTLDNYSNSIMYNRISNSRYFDLYFTDNQNLFVLMNKETNNIIENINNNENFMLKTRNLISNYSDDELKLFLELLQLNIKKINGDRYLDLIKLLFEFNEKKNFFSDIREIGSYSIIYVMNGVIITRT